MLRSELNGPSLVISIPTGQRKGSLINQYQALFKDIDSILSNAIISRHDSFESKASTRIWILEPRLYLIAIHIKYSTQSKNLDTRKELRQYENDLMD